MLFHAKLAELGFAMFAERLGEMTENELSTIIIGATIGLHRALGPGLLEKVYEEALSLDVVKKDWRCNNKSGFR